MSRYSQLSVDELLAEGAALENRLRHIEAEYDPLALEVEAEGYKLRRVAGKLGLSSTGAIAGIMAIPFTAGWSLVAALAPTALAVWEMRDFAADYQRLRPVRRRLARLLLEAADIADQLDAISKELDSRT